MKYDSNLSPVGWYVGTYQVRFVELDRTDNENTDRRFLVWENTVLVRADNLYMAYDKVVAIGLQHTEPYKGGAGDIDVQWVFEGIVSLLPVYEGLEDGAEIAWWSGTRKLKTMRKRARTKEQCYQHQEGAQPVTPGDAPKRGAPLS